MLTKAERRQKKRDKKYYAMRVSGNGLKDEGQTYRQRGKRETVKNNKKVRRTARRNAMKNI